MNVISPEMYLPWTTRSSVVCHCPSRRQIPPSLAWAAVVELTQSVTTHATARKSILRIGTSPFMRVHVLVACTAGSPHEHLWGLDGWREYSKSPFPINRRYRQRLWRQARGQGGRH